MKQTHALKDARVEGNEFEHGERAYFPHKLILGKMNFPLDDDTTEIDCLGEVYWEEVLEGFVCCDCSLYTGVK